MLLLRKVVLARVLLDGGYAFPIPYSLGWPLPPRPDSCANNRGVIDFQRLKIHNATIIIPYAQYGLFTFLA
jgi:hypothetical protein